VGVHNPLLKDANSGLPLRGDLVSGIQASNNRCLVQLKTMDTSGRGQLLQ